MCTRFASEEDYQLDSAEEKNEETTIGSFFLLFVSWNKNKKRRLLCLFFCIAVLQNFSIVHIIFFFFV